MNRARNTTVKEFCALDPVPYFVDGEWSPGVADPIAVFDPANGLPVATVACADEAAVDSAARAARSAFDRGTWSRARPDERARQMNAWADLVDRDSEVLAEMETLQTGKPIRESRGDVARALDGLRFYAAAARNQRGEVIDVSDRHHSYVIRQPLGVVAAIVPWNVPIVLTISKVAPALAAGNSVIVKPSQTTPLTALYLAKLWEEANLPRGVYNVINGPGRSVGETLCLHPLVTGMSFTGGTDTGLHLGELAARQNKRVMLELGGKSPNIVLADADLTKAIPGAANAIFYGQGQICAAGSRLLVEAPIYDQVVEGVAAIASSLQIGDPLDEVTEFGCLTSQSHRDEILGWVDRATQDGASVAAGGHVASVPGLPNGAFMEPTVLVDVPPTAPISCEEVFGPVLVVQRVDGEEQAIAWANDSSFGLSAGVWSRDSGRARRIAGRLEAGVVWINDYGVFNPAMPFGGVKLSGSSHREWSHLALDAYLEHKSIWEANS